MSRARLSGSPQLPEEEGQARVNRFLQIPDQLIEEAVATHPSTTIFPHLVTESWSFSWALPSLPRGHTGTGLRSFQALEGYTSFVANSGSCP